MPSVIIFHFWKTIYPPVAPLKVYVIAPMLTIKAEDPAFNMLSAYSPLGIKTEDPALTLTEQESKVILKVTS